MCLGCWKQHGGQCGWDRVSEGTEARNAVKEVEGQDAPSSAHGCPFLTAAGFITMTPQLFINYKLKSVAHLPWRMLTYKALNTFIDDLFAFVIKMPVMYRIGCLRDGEARWAGGWAGRQAPTRAGHGQGPGLREARRPQPGGSAHSLQDPPAPSLTVSRWALPLPLTLPPRPTPRCGLLHLPLPTVDLSRRPHAGERVWHEWRGPDSSRGPSAGPRPHHDHRRRQGGGLHTPAHQAHPGGQL